MPDSISRRRFSPALVSGLVLAGLLLLVAVLTPILLNDAAARALRTGSAPMSSGGTSSLAHSSQPG